MESSEAARTEESAQETPSGLPETVVTPGWIRLGELTAVLLLAAHCLAGPRRTETDMLVFGCASVLIVLLRRHLPAPPSRRASGRELTWLVGFTLVSVGVAAAFGQSQGAAPTPRVIARTLLIYVAYAFLQQFLTQRYLVVRLQAWLGWSSPVRVALVVGAIFALLHLPYPGLILPTALAGFVWSVYYLTSGRLLPVVISHVLLGSSFILWVLGRDPFAHSLFASFL